MFLATVISVYTTKISVTGIEIVPNELFILTTEVQLGQSCQVWFHDQEGILEVKSTVEEISQVDSLTPEI